MRTCDCLIVVLLATPSLIHGQGKSAATQQAAGRRKGRDRKETVSTAKNGGGDGGLGSGAEYLELTEREWDGKSPWFTGSRKCVFSQSCYVQSETEF